MSGSAPAATRARGGPGGSRTGRPSVPAVAPGPAPEASEGRPAERCAGTGGRRSAVRCLSRGRGGAVSPSSRRSFSDGHPGWWQTGRRAQAVAGCTLWTSAGSLVSASGSLTLLGSRCFPPSSCPSPVSTHSVPGPGARWLRARLLCSRRYVGIRLLGERRDGGRGAWGTVLGEKPLGAGLCGMKRQEPGGGGGGARL